MNEEEQLDRLIELAGGHARMVLVELKQNLVPSWVLISRDGKIRIVPTPWRDEEEKQRYVAEVRRLMRKQRVQFYSFVSEAWTATLEPGQWDEAAGQPVDGIRASKRPEREEAVLSCACSKELVRWKQWRIVREATTERVIDLKENPIPQCAFESWISEMLK